MALYKQRTFWQAVIVGCFLCSGCVKTSPPPYILILYLNETSPEADEATAYLQLQQWLHSAKDSQVREFSERLTQDAAEFQNTVASEIAAIESANRQGWLANLVIIFTNKLARQRKFMVIEPSRSTPAFLPLAYPVDENPVLRANPLAAAKFFEVALETSATLLPPQGQVILVTKSHGNDKMALMPLIRLWPQDTNPDELAEIIKTILHDTKQTNTILPRGAHLIGTNKEAYFEILDKALFPVALLFMESCFASLPAPGDKTSYRLPTTVSEMFASIDQGTSYRNLDYSAVFKDSYELKGDTLKAFRKALKPQFYRLRRISLLEQLVEFITGIFN